MINLSLNEVANTLQLPAIETALRFNGISTDTRTLLPGNLFVAIVGEKLDGHDYIEEAFNKGAAAALVNHKVESPLLQLCVNDTVAALGKICSLWRDRFSIPVIGVTGSNGKTTLKNMIASILVAACDGDKTKVLATQGNLNNHIGLPLTLAQLSDEHRYAVFEMGTNHFGEIAYLTRLAKPDVAVVNNAAPAHLEGLETVAGVARAKGEIFLGLPKNGTAILNRDDEFFSYWKELTAGHPALSFGLNAAADITATVDDNQSVMFFTPKGNMTVTLPLLGMHNVLNALAATAATLAVGIDLAAIKLGLEKVAPAPGRLRQHMLPNGVRLIDDTYNANPGSVTAAIETLAHFPGEKILILGDMKELGPQAKKLHEEIGQKALQKGIHWLLAVGENSLEAVRAFGAHAKHFKSHDDLIDALPAHLHKETTILIKGSRSMKMEKIVAGLESLKV